MVTSIDYAAFPHIFMQVLRHCDLATQKTLRLLSSSAKADIDRDHCHSLYISVKGRKLSLLSLLVGTDRVIIIPPLLTLWDGQILTQFPQNERVVFALNNARSLLTRDNELVRLYRVENVESSDDTGGTEPLVSNLLNMHLRPDCTVSLFHDPVFAEPNCTVSLSHDPASADRNSYSERRIQLPPVAAVNVQASRSSLPCPCEPTQTTHVMHSARQVRLTAAGQNASLCGFILNMVTPTVEDLTLVVDHPDNAASFFEATKHKPRNPNLKVTVRCRPVVPQPIMVKCSEEWTGMFHCVVHVQHQ
ncbi:hypothetical protein A1Q1_07296 [Trichosporon asahii var. asahii CBS 2479]|uniref:F-box domain-containing protein n=1 Tax=Trichosporon asahii var. asahii (strain ATCC 90039 / CBS 2479 / JCM 2466 / KCTC 7840 / NBRC 103889/ NCYC 2677 / UAMH 7654) TaxID=1186058 RepID=J6F3I4_TRIAS|nr:hypothetical protein A1Q1_07296 [Trichosporon asahii var. asahii CBS 2479]EJT51534.1 hypothetical protein A1Q1_07296 [Trichosporon asahii var. asahii CBS 2479]